MTDLRAALAAMPVMLAVGDDGEELVSRALMLELVDEAGPIDLRPDPRCRLHGQPREGEWSCSCYEETEWESAEEHIVRMAVKR